MHVRAEFDPEARSVGAARRHLRTLLDEAGAAEWIDPATLAVSEIVTNAVVHTGARITMDVWIHEHGLRVEVVDRSPRLPAVRSYAVTAGTGRGLQMVADSVSRWGAAPRGPGKVVWFELGRPPEAAPPVDAAEPASIDAAVVTVTLRNVPLLMHWAWQEHAQALLREYLLFAFSSDPHATDLHAEASDALNVLSEQVPVPYLPEDPEELLADALEPGVSADELVVNVPLISVKNFASLDKLLQRASAAAAHGFFLGPPTQPEISELREWICAEIARQSATGAEPQPWAPRTGVREPLADATVLHAGYGELLNSGQPILATDGASLIVAVAPAVVRFLGYRDASELLGRRVIAVVPTRFHQAHIAGTTLNATNGRDRLLGAPVTVPVVRQDGSEVLVELCVTAQHLADHRRVFVAHFDVPAD